MADFNPTNGSAFVRDYDKALLRMKADLDQFMSNPEADQIEVKRLTDLLLPLLRKRGLL